MSASLDHEQVYGTSITSREDGALYTRADRDRATRKWIFAPHTPVVTQQELINSAQRRLAMLRRLESGWDNANGQPLDPTVARLALALVGIMTAADDVATPQFSPKPDGGVDIAWLVSGNEIGISVSPHYASIWAFDEREEDIFEPYDVALQDIARDATFMNLLIDSSNFLVEISNKIKNRLPLT